METLKKNNKEYYIASLLMIIFVFSDLAFDYLFNFSGSNIISLLFTLGASIIVFVFNFKINRKKISGNFEEVNAFIQGNFDNWQVLYSVLDIICGIISVLSGVLIVSCVFKAIKMVHIPTKIVVVVNKEKTLIKNVSRSGLIWTACRSGDKVDKQKYIGETNMKKFITNIKNNPRTIIFGFISALAIAWWAFSVASYIGFPIIVNYITGGVFGILGFLFCYIVGWDTVKSIVFFVAKKKLSEDKYEQLVKVAESLIDETEADNETKKEDAKTAKKEAKDRIKALKLAAKIDAKNKAKAEEKAEEERLLALAEKIKAEEAAKNAEKISEDRPQE